LTNLLLRSAGERTKFPLPARRPGGPACLVAILPRQPAET
jgi:hypothetical protein